MATKGNESALTYASITELTGEEEHERLTEVEIIFGSYEDIDAHAFRRCANLQSVTLINCRLRCIPMPALVAVRASLVHLCLSSQNISKMERLDLPNLHALYLQHNAIERIQGLEKCQRLQRLWLCGNRVRRIENLNQCADLRELWLQDNAIQSLSASESDPGVKELVNLETLCLAKNRIRLIDELQALRKLINLRSLVMADEHFGSNPIVRHPEYRAVAVSTLRHLQTLDGIPVEESERTWAVDQFQSQAMAFSNVVAELTLNYEQELRSIQNKKEKDRSNAEMMQRELIEALNEVEQLVVRGTAELNQEKNRHAQLRSHHTQLTAATLKGILELYSKSLDKVLEEELKIIDGDELLNEVLEQEAEAEHDLAATLSTVQSALPRHVAVEHLTDHAADYQHIAAKIEITDKSDLDGKYRLLQVHRFYHAGLVMKYDDSFTSHQDNQSPAEGSVAHLYCVVRANEILDILQHGFDGSNSDKWLLLFSNPLQALELSEGSPGSCGNDSEDPASTLRMRSHLLLMCQVMITNVSELTIGEATMNQLKTLSSIVSIASVAVPNSTAQERQHEFIHAEVHQLRHRGDVYIINRQKSLFNVLPNFIVLCSQRLAQVKSSSVQDTFDQTPEDLLSSFSHEVEDEILNYQHRLWKEIDPEVWSRKSQFHREKARLDQDIACVKERIGDEKQVQRKLLKPARQRK